MWAFARRFGTGMRRPRIASKLRKEALITRHLSLCRPREPEHHEDLTFSATASSRRRRVRVDFRLRE